MRRLSESRWVWISLLAFVVLTLAALVTIPLLVQNRVEEHRARIEASEPARTALMGLQFNLVREMASLREFLVTGDPTFVNTYSSARAAEQQTFAELAPLAAQLGPEVFEQFIQSRTLAEQWHNRTGDSELLQGRTQALRSVDQTELRRGLEEVLRSTARLDSTIVRTTAQLRARIAAAERRGLQLTFLTGTLALLTAIAVGMLIVRVRKLAKESERRGQETAAALAESARAAEARNRLLRGITHDVKNPLGAARGYAELLAMGVKGELTEEQHAMIKGVERSLDSALAILSDLLDLARTDSGGITVQRVSTDLNDIARQVVDDHRAAAEAAGHSITCDAQPQPLRIYTDPARVRQVLDNLLSNAIKYTPAPGQITVRAEAHARDATRLQRAAAIRVSDTGPGIAADDREHIFDEFTRLDDGGSLKGHGLGLAIARRLARMLGGDLGVADDDRQKGATFVLWLPQREHF